MSAATFLLAPAANRTYVVTSGRGFTSDAFSLIESTTMSSQDQIDLMAQGCQALTPLPQFSNLIGSLAGATAANFNSTADQIIALGFNSQFRITRIVSYNASLSLTTAVGGIYTGLAKTGTQVVANTQAYSSLTSGSVALDLTLATPNQIFPANTPLYLSLTTPQGGACTCSLAVFGDLLP
jgi:hypothetical protein